MSALLVSYMFEPEAGGVSDADQPRNLCLLLPDHQLGQHVANTEDVEKWNLKIEWLVYVAILLCSIIKHTLPGFHFPGLNT